MSPHSLSKLIMTKAQGLVCFQQKPCDFSNSHFTRDFGVYGLNISAFLQLSSLDSQVPHTSVVATLVAALCRLDVVFAPTAVCCFSVFTRQNLCGLADG